MGDSKGAAAFISDGPVGSPQTLTGVEIRRCITPLLFNGTSRAMGTRSGRRPGAGGVPTISGITVSIPAGSCVVDAGVGNAEPPFLVSWGGSVPTLPGIAADSTNPRVDVVYVRVNEVLGSPTTQDIKFGYQAGTPSSSPVAPSTVDVDNLPIRQVCVLAYINVPASGGGAATVTPGPTLALASSVIRCNGPADYPTAANCVDGTVLWDYSTAVREFVVLIAGAWVVRDTAPGQPKIQKSPPTGTSVVTNLAGNGSVTFPVAFDGAPTVVVSVASTGGGLTTIVVSPGGISSSGFTFTPLDNNHNVMAAGSTVVLTWIAVYQP